MGPYAMFKALTCGGPFDCELGGQAVSVSGDRFTPAAPDHLIELVERHEFSIPCPPFLDSGTQALDSGTQALLLSVCRAAALEWGEAVGLDVKPDQVVARHDPEPRIGVAFTVYVGKGAGPAGATPRWRWSIRWRDWWRLFCAMNDPGDLDAARAVHAERHT